VATHENRDYLPTQDEDFRDPAEAIAVGDSPASARLVEIR
jgi:hypothetical protein